MAPPLYVWRIRHLRARRAAARVIPYALPITTAPIARYSADIGITLASGRVGSWADVTGTSGAATQATAGNQPSADAYPDAAANPPSVQFDLARTDYMNLPAGLSVDSQNLTIQATLDWSSNIPPSASVPFVIGSGGFTIYQDNSSGNGGVIVYKDTPTPRTTTTRFPSSRSVVTLVSNSSGMKLFLNGTLIHSSGVASAGIVSGGYIGAYGSGPSLPFSGNLHELIVWNTALSDADVGSMATAAASAWNFALAPSKRVVFVGDSISEGLVAGAGKSWIRLLDLPQTACDIMKVVRSSITLTVQTASVSSWVDTFAGPNATLVLFCHTNDIYADGHTGAAVYTAFKNYANGRRAAGFGKIVGINILSRTNGGTLSLETERVAFNNALAADHSFLDAYIDVTTDANLGAPTAYSNPVYFGGDQTHPVLAGHAALAALAGPSIKALL